MDRSFARNEINDFLNKAYEMVDDPSTDSIVSWGPNGRTFLVWKPLKDSRDLLRRHLGITSFERFVTYGFSKIVNGEQMEYICDDFVRGQPNLLEKIADRFVARLQASYEKKYKPFDDRLKNCKNKEECDLAIKEQREIFAKERRERMATRNLDMDLSFARNEINDFLNKAYMMVDDPSTDSIVSWGPNGRTFLVWKPLEDSRDFIKRHLGIKSFARFFSYGFSKVANGEQMEYLCDDFVRGQPNLLEKIADRFVARMQPVYEKWYK